MKEVKKKSYQAPKLTTASFKPERGYVSSGEFLFGAFVPEEQTIESRSNTGGYFGDGGSGDESTWF